MKKIIASGYFNPLHVGHVEYLKLAKNLGDKLIVIVNNDNQVKLKGSCPFMNENDRMRIINELKCVDDVFLSIDQDASVCRSIEHIARTYGADIFAKGGDRNAGNIPEKTICDYLGIKIVDGLGEKIRASSELIKNSGEQTERPWGNYKVVEKVKIINVKPNSRISLQYHNKRDELWKIISGEGIVTIGEEKFLAKVGNDYTIPKKTIHRIETEKGVSFLEVSLGEVDENDIIRIEDDYGRIK